MPFFGPGFGRRRFGFRRGFGPGYGFRRGFRLRRGGFRRFY
ncbi:hypothetical protein [Metabacillus litoralis]|nr:hypothetical protein [Metabacillus litoralis]